MIYLDIRLVSVPAGTLLQPLHAAIANHSTFV
jgi:hypothetical protein